MCYRDMTFCPFNACKNYGDCFRALKQEDIDNSNKENSPLATFVAPPEECFNKDLENNRSVV